MERKKRLFSKIYDKYIDKIYGFTFFKVNSQEIAEDLTSEAFSRTWAVFRKKDKEIDNIQAFLYKTAKNLVIDHYRQKGKTQVVSTEDISIADPRHNLEEEAILNSDVDNIKEILYTLKEDYQNVIIWYYLDDLSISEISNVLGRTKETTRVLLHRALNALKVKIKEN
ncbi:MAG: sigma-70 family RNA polymerase sigma factor [Patescibacteria group bacterium]|nr:sigma-70 family RNA polymerase sigma factor [Patescibacteria group bacterium]